jgi:hypothetical protein
MVLQLTTVAVGRLERPDGILGGVETERSRFCQSCGEPVEPNDRFCGRCGADLRRDPSTEDLPPDGDDPLAEWERHRKLREPDDEAPTETIPAARPGDTAVLPEVVPSAPSPPGLSAPPAPVATLPRPGFPLGATVALVGAISVILSAIVPWASGPDPAAFDRLLPRDIAFQELFFGVGEDPGGPTLGLVLLGAGVAGGLMALLSMVAPALKPLRRLIGLGTLAIPVLFVLRVVQASVDQGGGVELVFDSLAAGVYLGAGGALVQVVAGRWFRR